MRVIGLPPIRHGVATAILAAVLSLSHIGSFVQADGAPGKFDFYVLSLSWSPTYCLAEGVRANRNQCSGSDPKAFIVHGLWPQFTQGYPEFCRSREPQRVPYSLTDKMLDIMPSPGLIGSQWRKHGTCTGLSQAEYLDLTRQAYERVAIPNGFEHAAERRIVSARTVEQAFIAANPGLSANGIAISCKDGRVAEVRICLSRSLGFQRCANVDRRGCQAARLVMPQAR